MSAPKLCELNDYELETGSDIDAAMKRAGFTEAPRQVINANGWWNITLPELIEILETETEVA